MSDQRQLSRVAIYQQKGDGFFDHFVGFDTLALGLISQAQAADTFGVTSTKILVGSVNHGVEEFCSRPQVIVLIVNAGKIILAVPEQLRKVYLQA